MGLGLRKKRTLSISCLPVVTVAAGLDRATGRPGSGPLEHQKQMRPLSPHRPKSESAHFSSDFALLFP